MSEATDARLDAVATARANHFRRDAPETNDAWAASEFLALYDTARAFDEQRKLYCGECSTPNECKLECVKQRKEVVQHRPGDRQADTCASASADNATAPLVGADPPWFLAALSVGQEAYDARPKNEPFRQALDYAFRAVLAFAARQPRKITEARPPWRECAALLVGRLLEYFNDYKLAPTAPLVEEIAIALTGAFDSGQREPRPITAGLVESIAQRITGPSDDPDRWKWNVGSVRAILEAAEKEFN